MIKWGRPFWSGRPGAIRSGQMSSFNSTPIVAPSRPVRCGWQTGCGRQRDTQHPPPGGCQPYPDRTLTGWTRSAYPDAPPDLSTVPRVGGGNLRRLPLRRQHCESQPCFSARYRPVRDVSQTIPRGARWTGVSSYLARDLRARPQPPPLIAWTARLRSQALACAACPSAQ
jgi:hypothetical protein